MKSAVACSKKWFFIHQKKNLKNYYLIKNKKQLNYKSLKKNNIQYIFFPHWSFIVPKKIYENFICVIFHTGNLPKHRGGSPIQNLILKGYKNAYVNAVKVQKKIDSGPIYVRKKVSLKGSLDNIFYNISIIILELMKKIITSNIKPKDQIGKKTFFKRLNKNNSFIKKNISSINMMYDKIRMLDSDEYDNANFNLNNFNFSFTKVSKKGQKIYANCLIIKSKK